MLFKKKEKTLIKRANHRKHERKNTFFVIDVKSDEKPGKEGQSAVIDISLAGAAFDSSQEFTTGEDVTLRFTLPGKDVYVLRGSVVRKKDRPGSYVYGVKFGKQKLLRKVKLKKLMSKICSKM